MYRNLFYFIDVSTRTLQYYFCFNQTFDQYLTLRFRMQKELFNLSKFTSNFKIIFHNSSTKTH